MKIETALKDCPKELLIGMLASIYEALWDPEVPWKENEWSPDTLDAIAQVFDVNDLHPYNLEEYRDEQIIQIPGRGISSLFRRGS